MNAIFDIYVAPCVSLQAELARRPWLSESERMAEAIDVVVAGAVEEALADKYTQDELDDATNEAESNTRQACVEEIDAILDRFDIDDPNYAVQCVAALNVWIKENA